MDCQHVWEQVSEFLDDTLTPEARAMVRVHLEHCGICSAVLDSTRNILILTADERVFELPLEYSRRLHARIEEEIAGSAKK